MALTKPQRKVVGKLLLRSMKVSALRKLVEFGGMKVKRAAKAELKRRGLKMKTKTRKKSSKFMLGKPSVAVPTPRSL